jgi:hypothetical protein
VPAVLDGLCVGDRHEAHPEGFVLVGPDDSLALALGETRLKIRPGTNQLQPWFCRRLLDAMPGASEQTRRVTFVNANWRAGPDGDHGRFEVMIVTEDDRRHVVAPSPAAMTALIALTQADTVLAWDPADRTLIAANLVGTMPWTERARNSPPVG